jgi:predicted transcriptional regulator YdeE
MKYIVKEFETRYFAGIELIGGFKVGSKEQEKVESVIEDLKSLYLNDIPNRIEPISMIGLEMYRFDFLETKMVDYFALVETDGLVEIDDESLVTKKLPKGKYIMFKLQKDDKTNEIKKAYKYLQGHQLNVHLGYHIEIYENQVLNIPENTFYLSFKLDE